MKKAESVDVLVSKMFAAIEIPVTIGNTLRQVSAKLMIMASGKILKGKHAQAARGVLTDLDAIAKGLAAFVADPALQKRIARAIAAVHNRLEIIATGRLDEWDTDIASKIGQDDFARAWEELGQELKGLADDVDGFKLLTRAQPSSGLRVGALRDRLGCSDESLRTYATKANVPTPGRGERNHEYTHEQIIAICRWLISSSSPQSTRTTAQTLLAEMSK